MADILLSTSVILLGLALFLNTLTLRSLSRRVTLLGDRLGEVESRQVLQELYELPPEVQLEQLKYLIDKKLENINGRND